MKCEHCRRVGGLIFQQALPPSFGINHWWVMRVYLCAWHRGAETRRRKKPVAIIPFLPDAALIAKAKAARKPAESPSTGGGGIASDRPNR